MFVSKQEQNRVQQRERQRITTQSYMKLDEPWHETHYKNDQLVEIQQWRKNQENRKTCQKRTKWWLRLSHCLWKEETVI